MNARDTTATGNLTNAGKPPGAGDATIAGKAPGAGDATIARKPPGAANATIAAKAPGAANTTIDVIVPVYNAAEDLRRCLEAVLEHTTGDYRLVVLDDASTDPQVGVQLRELEQRALARVTVLRHERNLGFTKTANQGMALSRADVVLLNSDAIPGPGWLDALRRCAASDPSIGTITPFSNNAEIASFPRFCEDNPVGDDAAAHAIAGALRAAAVPSYPELPTGVGFCLYIRRTLIDAIGTFDTAFGAGYGEENDFCLRAVQAGWRNVLADDAYVRHTGGRSFEGRKGELGSRNMPLLLDRHPHYLDMVHAYIAADPLRPLRDAARTQLAAAGSDAGVLHVIHDHGGGTETHVRALIDASRRRWRHYLAIAVGDAWQVEEHRADGSLSTYTFERGPGESWTAFLAAICASFRVGLIHLHNISACRDGLLSAMPSLGVPYGYTVHDLNFACPTITFLEAGRMYCGAQTDLGRCMPCLNEQPRFAGVDIEDWRRRHAALIEHAAFVIAPSQWAARTFARYFPARTPTVIAHGHSRTGARTPGARAAVMLPDDGVPTVAVLGAIGPDKGARRLERLVELARSSDAHVRFVLIGYLDVQHEPWQSDDARLTVHGRYAPQDLADLLAHYRVDLVIYPSAGPETFSYTLSEAWSAGRPVLVPPFGALAERVEGTGAGFVMTEREWRDEAAMLERIVSLVNERRDSVLRTAARAAPAVATSSLERMADATIAVYATARVTAPPIDVAAPFTAQRLRDALGYRPWTPPRLPQAQPQPAGVPVAPEAARLPWPTRVARRALAIRHTTLGRALYRLAPQPLLDALKARLSA
jgi:GT2 family glycosyltransferase/glycosyltransferase involved in cell wall biosynthesis